MRVLMHVCCGPCTLYPLGWLRGQGHEVEGYFYNPNIHPYREFRKRLEVLQIVASQTNLPLDIVDVYDITGYLRQVVFHETTRCNICVDLRLEQTVQQAKKSGAEAFTTSLLYSRYQNHRYIKHKGEELAALHDLPFLYQDFRSGWQQGIEEALAMNLYRQPYCGCIYSEQERYDKSLRKKKGAPAGGGPPTARR